MKYILFICVYTCVRASNFQYGTDKKESSLQYSYNPATVKQQPACGECDYLYKVDEKTSKGLSDVSVGVEACGEQNLQARVVNGDQANENAYPWLGRLIYFNSFGCGASLINDRYVVSAAHCVKGFMWFMFRVTFGEHDRCSRAYRPETRYVTKFIIHDFSVNVLANDIALALLNKPVQYSHTIRPVCLPKTDDSLYISTEAVIAGWGAKSENGNWSCTLLRATVPVLSNEDCKKTKYNSSRIMDGMLCAGYPDTAHVDGCTGDSGGPLIAKNKNHAYEMIGIVSWGYGCARKGYPGVYTRVNKYLKWIKENTEDSCYCRF